MKPIEIPRITISKRIRVYTVYNKLYEQGIAEEISPIYQHIRIIVGKQNIAFLAKNVSRLGAYATTNMLMCLWFPH